MLLRLHRTVHLHFNFRTDPVPPGSSYIHIPMRRISAAVLLSDEVGAGSTTTALAIGKVAYNGRLPLLYAAYLLSRIVIPSAVLSRLGTPIQTGPGITSLTFKLGTTSMRDVDIIHPETGAGVWVNTLEANPRISPTNLHSSVFIKLLGELNVVPGGAFGALSSADFLLMRQCFQEMNMYQLARNVFSTFPVMVLIYREPRHEDLVYNIAEPRNPRKIPASPHNHLAVSMLEELAQDPRYNGAVISGEVAPQAGGGNVMRHQIHYPGIFNPVTQSYHEDDVGSDDSGEGSASGRQPGGPQQPQARPSLSRLGRSHSY